MIAPSDSDIIKLHRLSSGGSFALDAQEIGRVGRDHDPAGPGIEERLDSGGLAAQNAFADERLAFGLPPHDRVHAGLVERRRLHALDLFRRQARGEAGDDNRGGTGEVGTSHHIMIR